LQLIYIFYKVQKGDWSLLFVFDKIFESALLKVEELVGGKWKSF
jgi:hypothetical protein